MQEPSQSNDAEAEKRVPTPRDHHAGRKLEEEREAERLTRISRLVSTLRLLTFVGAFGLMCARGFGYLSPFFSWLGFFLAGAFVFLVVRHARLDKSERRVRAAIDFHRWALERLDGGFEKYPSKGERFASDDHPYTSDLGIFGQ